MLPEPVSFDEKTNPSVGLVIGLAALATVILGVQPSLFWDWAVRSIELLGS